MKRTDTETSIKVLALIARGDSAREVSEATGVKETTVVAIKNRNPTALAAIRERMVDHQVSSSKKILSKSHKLIERKLDKAATADTERAQALKEYKEGDIEYKELQARLGAIYDPTITELNAVSKEAFNQSQIEMGKPTSISNSPAEAKNQLNSLVEALNVGDEVALFKMVLTPGEIIEGEIVK